VAHADATSGLTVTITTPIGSHPLTAQGTVVGTFQYMSPEQVEGKEADARSDIFALGAVLYEMVTAKRAFEGKTAASAMAAVLEREPAPISSVQPMSPPGLDHVVQGCLAKDPEARWQSATDIARELRWIASGGAGAASAPPIQRGARWRDHAIWSGVAVVLLAALAWSMLRGHESARTLRLFLPPPEQTNFDFTGDFSGPPVINEQGTAVAFSARSPKERSALWVHTLGDLAARKLEGTEGASFPFWSADGKWLGFFGDAHLKKVQAAGGPVTVLAEAPNPRGGAWSRDNVILFEADYRDTLFSIGAAGGTPARLTKFVNSKQTTHRWPQFLPDGKHFLFFAASHSGDAEQGVYYGSLSDGGYRHVLDSDSQAVYASGYLVYHVQTQLLAQKFDPEDGKLSGDPVLVANFVEYDAGTWHTSVAASQNGILIYEPGSKTLGLDLFWLDRKGNTLGKVADRGFYKGAGRVSPDGKRLAVSQGDPQADIWILDLATGSKTRLTFGGGTHLQPSWSADGRRVVYVRQNGSTVVTGSTLRIRLASGGGQEETIPTPNDPATLLSPQFTPDGKSLVYTSQKGPSEIGIWTLSLENGKASVVVPPPAPPARIIQERLSPDGKWLAYSSTESGREEVYVTHYPSGQGRWQVSQNGGTFPSWSADGNEIWFVATDLQFETATVNRKNPEFEITPLRPMFSLTYTSPLGTPFDLSPDGQKILTTALPLDAPTPIVLVSNWTNDARK
jgi:Tol biopolymer transport system component